MRAAARTAAALALLAAGAAGQERAVWLELELRGPLEELTVPARSPTVVRARLAAGERRRVRVPVLLAAGEAPPEVDALRLAPAGGSVAALGVEDAGWEAWRAGLPIGLRARTLPPLPAPPARPAPALLALLVAGSVAVVAARRRPVVALAAGGGAAAVLWWLPLAPASAPTARVHEGDAVSGRWILVEAARDRLALDPERLPELRAEGGRDGALELTLTAGGAARLAWVARGALLCARRDDPRPPALAAGRNGGPALARCWTRGAAGAWSARGEWPRGRPLPPERPELERAPPGWLAAALPQGVPVLVGAVAAEEAGAAAEWVRRTGGP